MSANRSKLRQASKSITVPVIRAAFLFWAFLYVTQEGFWYMRRAYGHWSLLISARPGDDYWVSPFYGALNHCGPTFARCLEIDKENAIEYRTKQQNQKAS